MTREKAIAELSERPEAYRSSIVAGYDPLLTRLADHVWAQRDYDLRRIEGLVSGDTMSPCSGITPEESFLARGAVDAIIERLRLDDGLLEKFIEHLAPPTITT